MKQFNNKREPYSIRQIVSLNNYSQACFLLIIASLSILFLNRYIYRYHGFNYIVEDSFIFMNAAIALKMLTKVFEPFKRLEYFANDCLKLFSCFLLLMLATTAIQYTPFELIDTFLFKYETLPLISLIDWTKAHLHFHDQLTLIYGSLNAALFFIPLLFVMLRQSNKVNSFCHYMIFTAIIGFFFYFFFPSCGPVHLYDKIHFNAAQINNYQKYVELHHGITPNLRDGGMIACPSFHVIWAWACARFFISNRILFPLALIWFLGVCASTILLGWHYSIDVLVAMLIISSYEMVSIWALKRSPY